MTQAGRRISRHRAPRAPERRLRGTAPLGRGGRPRSVLRPADGGPPDGRYRGAHGRRSRTSPTRTRRSFEPHVCAAGRGRGSLAAENRLVSLYNRHSDDSGVAYASRLRPLPNLRPRYRYWLTGPPARAWIRSLPARLARDEGISVRRAHRRGSPSRGTGSPRRLPRCRERVRIRSTRQRR